MNSLFKKKGQSDSKDDPMTASNRSDTTTSSSPSATGKTEDEKPHVTFYKVYIREYVQTLGDNPSVSSGPPLTLDWYYNDETKMLTIEEYEATRPERRSKLQLLVPRDLREKILKAECGVSRAQLAKTIRSVKAVQANRRQTVNNLKYAEAEEKAEKVKETLGRVTGVKKHSDKEFEILWEKTKHIEKLSSTTTDSVDWKPKRPFTPHHPNQ